MAELPELVRQRLRQQAGGNHPDADLLTAFAEGSLTERERSHVLAHLGACGACREVVSLALPETPALQPAHAPAESGWLRWPVLRWGAMAAAVVIVAAAVLLREPRRPPVMDDGSTTSTATHVENAPAKPPSQDKEARTEAEAKDNVVAKAKVSAPKSAIHWDMKVADAESRKKDEAIVARQAPPAVAAVHGTPEGAATNELQQQRAQAAQESVQQPARADQQAVQAGASAGMVQKQRQFSMAQQAAPAPSRAQAAPAPSSQGGQQNMATDRAEPAAPAASTVEVTGATGAVMRKSAAMRVLPVRWRVSSEGKLERSLDSGANWRVVALQEGTRFRAVSANDGDVWAGGAAGALYHSANGGQTWIRVVARAGADALTSDIMRVEFTDTLRGVVTTVSGETWITADGGRTWTARRP